MQSNATSVTRLGVEQQNVPRVALIVHRQNAIGAEGVGTQQKPAVKGQE